MRNKNKKEHKHNYKFVVDYKEFPSFIACTIACECGYKKALIEKIERVDVNMALRAAAAYFEMQNSRRG